jgi:hypothetical protein
VTLNRRCAVATWERIQCVEDCIWAGSAARALARHADIGAREEGKRSGPPDESSSPDMPKGAEGYSRSALRRV